MHELGVVFHIADTLARIAKENQVTRIRRVTLELGEVSTVVPEYLIDVWNWNCKRTPLLTGCELVIERIPAVTHCGACGRDYPTVPQGKICPHCGSPQTWLLQGNEFTIKEIAVPDTYTHPRRFPQGTRRGFLCGIQITTEPWLPRLLRSCSCRPAHSRCRCSGSRRRDRRLRP